MSERVTAAYVREVAVSAANRDFLLRIAETLEGYETGALLPCRYHPEEAEQRERILAAYEAGERGSYEKVNFGYMIGRVWSTDRAGIGDLPVRIVREVEP